MSSNTKTLVEALHNHLNQAGNINSQSFYSQLNHYLSGFDCTICSLGYADKTADNAYTEKWLDTLLNKGMSRDDIVIKYHGEPIRLMNRIDLKYLLRLVNDIMIDSMVTFRDALVFVNQTIDKHVFNLGA